MINTLKTFGISAVVVIVALLLFPTGGSNVGGTYENVRQYFSAGIDVTESGDIKVDGTTVIDASGNVDAPITSATGNFSGAVNVLGQLTAKEGAVTLTSSTTLTAADSGNTYYAGTANLAITLPASSTAGFRVRVVVNGNFATTNMVVQGPLADANDDLIYGALEVAGAVVACSAEDTVSFVNTAELPGDFIEIRGDGTKYYVTGQATTSGGITCTDAD